MLDLRDDGTIGIDFEDGGPTVVLSRPKFGAYKRMRADASKLNENLLAFIAEIDAQEPVPDDRNTQVQEKSDALTIGWWSLVLLGDETFKALTTAGTVPPDPDDWPAYLIYGSQVIAHVLGHWRNIPLAHSGVLVTATPSE